MFIFAHNPSAGSSAIARVPGTEQDAQNTAAAAGRVISLRVVWQA
jgi:hypothetical protein